MFPAGRAAGNLHLSASPQPGANRAIPTIFGSFLAQRPGIVRL
jgi:hypothetical protein